MENNLSLTVSALPFPQQWLPAKTYLVGGSVRDALLGRKRSEFDLDLVLEANAVSLARSIAHCCQAGFVVLDKERDIARVVFEGGTVDFAKIEGQTLEQDLRRRDFTINAIAYQLHQKELIDPLGGKQDLDAGIIKMVSPANLQEDPLRLLRAYRQAAQLQFQIDETTRETVRNLAPYLKQVAGERVQMELSYIFAIAPGSFYLQQAWEDGILSTWFPSLTAQQVKQVPKVDAGAKQLSQRWPKLSSEWEKNVGGKSDSLQALAKLACLVPNSPELAEEKLTELKYSRAEIRTVTGTIKLLPQLLNTDIAEMTLRDQYFFFQEAVQVFPCLLLTAVAKGLNIDAAGHLIERYLNPQDPVTYPQPIVTGKELLRSLSLSPSPLIGKLLTELQIAYLEGKIQSQQEALELARSWLASDAMSSN
ncbi:MAG: [cytidine(C)-cytidine(C)-adenosine (A)]-adding enzyme [Cyanobacteria bacterium SW_9_44_58]|nr:MAG: [cytidine(C)-cytidine(C)-adenosine (A)]-adding enzyme [Cyanobacteria bacterium SW_9_44_58]